MSDGRKCPSIDGSFPEAEFIAHVRGRDVYYDASHWSGTYVIAVNRSGREMLYHVADHAPRSTPFWDLTRAALALKLGIIL